MNYCQRCGQVFWAGGDEALCPDCETDDDAYWSNEADARREEAAYRELHRSDNAG